MRLLAGSAFFLAMFGLSASGLARPPGAPLGHAKPAPGSPAAVKAAKKHFDAAKAAYKAGQYQTAVDELNQAIESDPKGKDLVYNLGLVEEKLGHIDEAIAAYKLYTEMETDTTELEKAIQTIRRLEGARDALKQKEDEHEPGQQPSETPPVEGSPRQPDGTGAPVGEATKKGRLDGWVFAAGGLALAAAGVGTYYGIQAVNERNRSQDATGPNTTVYELQDRANQAHSNAVTADIFFGIAIGSAAAGTLLYFLRDAEPSSKSATVGVTVTPQAFAIGVGGRL
jgi:tetratricopeptide (TPR) repeat protein